MDAEDDVHATLFKDWSLTKLGDFLKENKQVVSGRKKEFIERCLVLKLTAVDKREIHQYDVDRKTNASFSDGNPIPNLNSPTNWTKDISKTPDVTDKDMYI